jgi:prepilin-type N-terminal cleavage/methylation domain-containing protein
MYLWHIQRQYDAIVFYRKGYFDMKNNTTSHNDAFTLIELLVSIAVIATIIGLALPNFLGARSRARDARRKGEIQQFKTALQLYYNDYKSYPADSGGPLYGTLKGCGAAGTLACPCSGSVDFAAGGSGCSTIYMTKLPSEFGTSMYYWRKNSGADFCLKVALENASDGDAATSQLRCAVTCAGIASGSDYIACSE